MRRCHTGVESWGRNTRRDPRMSRIPGRWLGIGIAVLIVGALALYAAGSGSHAASPSTTGSGGLFAPVDGQPQPAQTIQPVPGMSSGESAGLVVKIGIVAAILGGSLWLLRRYAGTTNRGGGHTGAITIADTIVLAQGRALYIVDVGDRALVLGATPQQLTYVADLTDPDVLEKLRAEPVRPVSPLAGISGLSARVAAALAARQSSQARPAPRPGRRPIQTRNNDSEEDPTEYTHPAQPAAR